MRPADRVVTRLPLQELFDDGGPVAAVRQRDLSAADVRALLDNELLRFVVVDVGSKPAWVPGAERFAFWKAEARPHLADPTDGADFDCFQGGYCYFASEWRLSGGIPVVVFELCH